MSSMVWYALGVSMASAPTPDPSPIVNSNIDSQVVLDTVVSNLPVLFFIGGSLMCLVCIWNFFRNIFKDVYK